MLITDPVGAPLSYALATDMDCGWVGYANNCIMDEMEAPLLSAIAKVENSSR